MTDQKSIHVMVDLETMGSSSNAAIVSIAATAFRIEDGSIHRNFHSNVSLNSALDLGLELDGDTIMWWLSQEEAARRNLMNPAPDDIKEALKLFTNYLNLLRDRYDVIYVWGNSARFDLGILADAYQKAGMRIPWSHRTEMCVRTIANIYPEIKAETVFEGVPHYPIDDCRHQIKYLCAMYQQINRK